MYTCTICKHQKDVLDFNRISSEIKKRGQCKECVNNKTKEWRAKNPEIVKANNQAYFSTDEGKEKRKSHSKQWYQKNKKEHIANVIKKAKLAREWINEIKSVPCMDCGKTFPPCCMDFDHREPHSKEFDIALCVAYPREKLEKEIAKCDIVCSNCHRIRTHITRKK